MAIKQLYLLILFDLYNSNIFYYNIIILILFNFGYIFSHTAYIRRLIIDIFLLF